MEDDICENNHGGNGDSGEAYLSSSERARKTLRDRIYNYALRRGEKGITSDEVVTASKITHNRISPRISELKKEGRLIPTSKTRKTQFGRSARVLIADVISEEQISAHVQQRS